MGKTTLNLTAQGGTNDRTLCIGFQYHYLLSQ